MYNTGQDKMDRVARADHLNSVPIQGGLYYLNHVQLES